MKTVTRQYAHSLVKQGKEELKGTRYIDGKEYVLLNNVKYLLERADINYGLMEI